MNIMNNPYFCAKAVDESTFKKAVELAFEVQNQKAAVGYSVDLQYGMIFYWVEFKEPKMQKLPFSMSATGAADFAWQWLQSLSFADRQRYASNQVYTGDGDNVAAWEVYMDEKWGYVGDDHRGICGIRPYWAYIGK